MSTKFQIIQLLLYLIISLFAESAIAQMSGKPEIPEEMDKISSFTGEWENTATFYNQEGEVEFREVFRSKAEPILGGRAISIRSTNKSEQAGATWFFYEPVNKIYVMVAIDAWGNYDEFSGNFEDGELILTSAERKFSNGRKMMWRRKYTEFGKDRHVIKMYYSVDGGANWIFSNEQLEQKVSS